MLHPLTPEDIPWINRFMLENYSPAYAYLWEDDGEWYLENMYSVQKITEEFEDERAEFFQVMDQGKIVGYCKTIRDKAPADASPGTYFYLQRLYLATATQGRGIGSSIMQELSANANAAGYSHLWLETMEVGASRRFYERLGFKQTGRIQLPFPGMVKGMRGLLIMQQTLANESDGKHDLAR